MDLEELFLIALEVILRIENNNQSCDSEYKNVTCGVPKGSILGPLLFILYVNDITNTTSLPENILFADDTTLLFSHPDISSKINSINMELDEISNWFKTNKLPVNASKKTKQNKKKIMILGTSHMTNKYIDEYSCIPT